MTNRLCVLEPCHAACGDAPCWGPGSDMCQISEWLQLFNSWKNDENNKTIIVKWNTSRQKHKQRRAYGGSPTSARVWPLTSVFLGQVILLSVHPAQIGLILASQWMSSMWNDAPVFFSDKDRVRPSVQFPMLRSEPQWVLPQRMRRRLHRTPGHWLLCESVWDFPLCSEKYKCRQ